VLCLFPFEPALLQQHGIEATYVGHPLAGVIPMEPDKAAARTKLGLALDRKVLALLPGSRSAEVQYIAKPFFAAAALVRAQMPDVQVLVPVVPQHWERMQQAVREAGVDAWLQLVKGQSHDVLAACDCTLIASGTATLEAALFKRPMVISYRMHPISWWLMRRKQLQPWVGLPNILCSDFVVPELLQDAATPEALAAATLDWLQAYDQAPSKIDALQARFSALHETLFRDTSALAADAIQKLMCR
ncbi:MAG: lipid-A-disaccharide synthase, partial [Comamonas sp.]